MVAQGLQYPEILRQQPCFQWKIVTMLSPEQAEYWLVLENPLCFQGVTKSWVDIMLTVRKMEVCHLSYISSG
jgi:hypothetical protein